MRRVVLHLAVLFTIPFAAACGGDGGGPAGPAQGNGSLRATVDGQSWTASSAVIALRSSNAISVAGTASNLTTISFAWIDEGTGTYSIPTSVGLNLNYHASNGGLWQAIAMGTQLGGVGTGTVTVTTLTNERVAGTFSFTAPAAENTAASGTRTVTNGSFDVRF